MNDTFKIAASKAVTAVLIGLLSVGGLLAQTRKAVAPVSPTYSQLPFDPHCVRLPTHFMGNELASLPHNSLVQNRLALGLFGIVLTAFQIVRNAYLLDSLYGGWQHTAFTVFLGLVGTGGVVQREAYWIALGSALLAMISTGKLKSPHRALAPQLGRCASDRFQNCRDPHARPSLG